ncbi:MAG: hypothetical protein N2044_03690 [Cyclobacteriaceae bacterium]|nr:hypothetical protein [Cyclobacteriaceae bacterium]MCX7636930.1 hypothetical protein [Cyclobacteriaceae bacterium]MDW8330373.1 hypothetical protein [Cyclobacteriaceae bacterium]
MSDNIRIRLKNFWVRLRKWEYWPLPVFQIPVVFYWLWFGLRARSLTFFTASNPGIELGGMFGESKYHILEKIPEQLRPAMVLIRYPFSLQQVLQVMQENRLSFPVIFKPNVGERGFKVERIYSEEEAARYLNFMKKDFIIQEMIELPVECGVFYIRKPGAVSGQVTSVNLKEMLTVTGDGISTLQELILQNERARLQWNRLARRFASRMHQVIPVGEQVILNHIGNHCLGTKFLNGEQLINEQLHRVFDDITAKIDGFYYGRFDLRCASVDDLYAGKIKILELNGCSSEPAHIYEPGFSLWTAYKTLYQHWREMYHISRINKELGFNYVPLRQVIREFRRYKASLS